MRKLLLTPAVLSCILVVFQSCTKQSTNNMVAPMRTDIVNATIAANGSYLLSMGNSANVSISKQASHFRVSQAEPDSKSGLVIYKYIPAVDYAGTDEVVLSSTKTFITTGGGGCDNGNRNSSGYTTTTTSYTTVKINITN